MLQLEGFEPAPIPGPKPTALSGARALQLRFLDDPVRGVLELRERGDVVGVVEADPALVCVFGVEHVRSVLEDPDHFQNVETFPNRSAGSSAIDITDRGLPRRNGDDHERLRRLLRGAFEPSALDDLTKHVVRMTAAGVARWPSAGITRVDQLCRDLVRSVAVTSLLGLPLDPSVVELGDLIAKLHQTRVASPGWLPEMNLPGLPHRRTNLLAREVVKRLEAVVEAKQQEPEPRGAFGHLVAASRSDTAGVSSDDLVGEAIALFTMSHEPTAMALAWTLFLLDQHADHLVAVQAELDEVLADRPPTRADLPHLGRLDRAVKESLRLLPPMPVLGFRVVAEGAAIGGMPLPANANVIISPLSQHREPGHYRSPTTFCPDRWFGLSPDPFVYLPFGAGARACIAQIFAGESLRLMLAVILQQRRLRCQPGVRIDRQVRGQVLQLKHGLPMRMTRPKEPTDPSRPVRGDVHDLVDLPAR